MQVVPFPLMAGRPRIAGKPGGLAPVTPQQASLGSQPMVFGYATPPLPHTQAFAARNPFKVKLNQPRFAGCTCAICMSIGLMVKERQKIEKLEAGAVDLPEVREDGFMRAMKDKTGYTFIPHYAATRLYPMARPDLKLLENSLMAPEFDRSDSSRIVGLQIPTAAYEGKQVFARAVDAFGDGIAVREGKPVPRPEAYPTVSKQLQFVPPLLSEQISLWEKLDDTKPQLFSIRHQVNKEDDPSPNTESMGLGGLVLRRVLPSEQKELAIVKPFEFLGFYRAGQLPAGLVNLLLLLTDIDGKKMGNYDQLTVLVDREKQSQLYDYVLHLTSLGVPIQEYAGGISATGLPALPVPEAYREEAKRWYTGQEHRVSMFRIDLAKIRQWRTSGLTEGEQARLEAHPLKTRICIPSRAQDGAPKRMLGEVELFKLLHEPAPIGKTLDDGMHSLREHGVPGFRAVSDTELNPFDQADHTCDVDWETPADEAHGHDHPHGPDHHHHKHPS